MAKMKCLLAGVVFGVNAAGNAAFAMNLSQTPLFIQDGVSPNIILSLDDSGSMERAYDEGNGGFGEERRYITSTLNPIYYNPNIVYPVPLKSDGTPYQTSFTKAYINGYNTSRGFIDLSSEYRPTYNYDNGSDHTLAYPGYDFSEQAAFYYVWDPSNGWCTSYYWHGHCYDKVEVPSDQYQNFANWYSFHRTRLLTTQTAANLAFHSLPDSVRVGFQGLNTCGGFSNSDCYKNNQVRVFSAHHRNEFFDWLARLTAGGGTPLRAAMNRAGKQYKKSGQNSPYAFIPYQTNEPVLSCRRNYHVMMTDGLWTGDRNFISNVDSKNQTLPDGTRYTPMAPYKDSRVKFPLGNSSSSSNKDGEDSLADVAFYYWYKDLATGIDNDLSPLIRVEDDDAATQYWNPQNNPASWQHMVNYLVGFGLQNYLSDPQYTGSTYSGGYQQLLNGSKDWPFDWYKSGDWRPGSDFLVYDLWHAAINSRGEFFSATDATGLINAFQKIINNIVDQSYSAAAASFDASVTRTLKTAYISSFTSGSWDGDVSAFRIDNNQKLWSAAQQSENKTWSDRKIYFVKNNALTAFNWGNLTTALKNNFHRNGYGDTDNVGESRVNWLRGDRSQEGVAGLFRTRNSVLGDFVNSSPVYVGKPELFGLGSSYDQFAETNKDRAARVYAAGNDGMLHAFDATTGEEKFVFIPSAMLDKLPRLSDKSYLHQYYLDVTPTVQDVYFDNQWHTILIGGMRGDQGLYALDITDPDQVKLLWEYSDQNDRDLGYTFNSPSIIKLPDGQWAAAVSNGYNNTENDGRASTTGYASLTLLKVKDGSQIKKFTLSKGSPGKPNALAAIQPADVNGDLQVDYLYGGDLYGNMWRFDLTDSGSQTPFDTSNSSQWKVGFANNPLFTAVDSDGDVQPISARPGVLTHPMEEGHIVLFGTGKYIEAADGTPNTSTHQSFYGIWDWQSDGRTSIKPTDGSGNAIARNVLKSRNISAEQQNISFGVDQTETQTVRTSGKGPINWSNDAGQRQQLGWYMDLLDGTTRRGELQISNPEIRSDLLLFTTLVPYSKGCSDVGVESWIYGLNAATGARLEFPFYDMNQDDVLDEQDLITSPTGSHPVTAIKLDSFKVPTLIGDRIYYNSLDGVTDVLYSPGERRVGRQVWKKVTE